MHEYSLIENVLESVFNTLKAEQNKRPLKIKKLFLEVGVLEIHSKEAFQQAFLAQALNTSAEGAELILEIDPGYYRCEECNHEEKIGIGEADGHLNEPVVLCANCGTPNIVQGGRGVSKMEIETSEN